MKKFPKDFTELLSRDGRAMLEGRHALCGTLATGKTRFVAAAGLLDAKKARQMTTLLEATLGDVMSHMEQPIPPEATWGMKVAYTETLPKTVSVRTAFIDHPRAKARRRAVESGLIALLESPGFHALAEALSGYPLRNKWGLQALCYQPGDYSGPHNDHHPDEPLGKDGYTDLHLTFCTKDVAQQLLVYERKQHLSQVQDVVTAGGVTCYRLPFWHYTTPLVAKPRREATARRWVLLGTFLDRWED